MTPTESGASPQRERLRRRLTAALLLPVDAAWLAAFRCLFGAAMAISLWRFVAYGWVERFFVEPSFHFKYLGFAWVEPLSGAAMHALFLTLIGIALAVALGLLFRVTAPLLALGLTYFQLIDVSTYLNHYYLAALLAWLLSASPAHRAWSLDSWIRRQFGRAKAPVGGTQCVAAAWLYLFRFQVGLVYVFAGLAKAQSDWLIHGQPLRIWLAANVDLPVVGPLFAVDGVALLFSWCGFLFDTTVVAFLSHRRTRAVAYAAVICFHVVTRLLFPIGMFPVIMILSALVFFEASWPRDMLRRIGRGRFGALTPVAPSASAAIASRELAPSLGARAALTLAGVYCAVQLLLPVRFLAYGGNVLWHEQGMRFSWRVMLRAKGGTTNFVVQSQDGNRVWHVSPRTYLTALQESEMSGQPDLILQLAQHIREDFARRGLGQVQVRADSRASLNGRRSTRFIDPSVDLAALSDSVSASRYILPEPGEPPPHTKPVL